MKNKILILICILVISGIAFADSEECSVAVELSTLVMVARQMNVSMDETISIAGVKRDSGGVFEEIVFDAYRYRVGTTENQKSSIIRLFSEKWYRTCSDNKWQLT